MHIFSLSMAVLPALYLLRYYYLEDNRKPEPISLIIKVFVLGILAVIPVYFLERFVGFFANMFSWSPLIHSFLEAFIVAALCEEWFKWKIIKHHVYDNPHFDEVIDGVIYTIVASLGFACMENILYVVGQPIHIAFVRAFTAVPLHAMCSGLMGYYIGISKFVVDEKIRQKTIQSGLVLAIFIHGLYDFLLFVSPYYGSIYAFAIFPLLVVIYFQLNQKIKLAKQQDGGTSIRRV